VRSAGAGRPARRVASASWSRRLAGRRLRRRQRRAWGAATARVPHRIERSRVRTLARRHAGTTAASTLAITSRSSGPTPESLGYDVVLCSDHLHLAGRRARTEVRRRAPRGTAKRGHGRATGARSGAPSSDVPQRRRQQNEL